MASIYQSIEILSKEKGIDATIILDAVKDALLVAARKQFKTTEELVADFDAKGNLHVYAVRNVVETVSDAVLEMTLEQARKIDPAAEIGGQVRIVKPTDALGRISAQTAKQVILQKVREAERETIFAEYSGRVGELVNCTIKRLDGQDYVCDLGKTEARLSKREQSRLENFGVGDRIRCVIRSVDKAGKNAGVVISRAAPEFVVRLFEQEVPEIYDGTVVIKGCSREAGERTKIAVFSRDRDVDCVGACVGMKGMRVQSIIRELRGERIDIIEYSDDPVVFATNALSPAKISRVTIVDAVDRHMEVIVEDTQLSLAIGKKGQNVRLAAKLLGWRVDIKSEEEKRQEVQSAMDALVVPGAPVSVLLEHGLSEPVVGSLLAGGVGTVERLGSLTPEDIVAIPGLDEATIGLLQMAVNSYYSQFETAETDAALSSGEETGPEEALAAAESGIIIAPDVGLDASLEEGVAAVAEHPEAGPGPGEPEEAAAPVEEAPAEEPAAAVEAAEVPAGEAPVDDQMAEVASAKEPPAFAESAGGESGTMEDAEK